MSTLLAFQSTMVDSMSPPHATEYISAQHGLAQDGAFLQRVEDAIEECRTRIARAQAQMCLLERQRDGVRRRMSVHRAQLSPLRAVPDQILQEIFRHCLPDASYIVPDTRSAPLVLTHVCRRWRIVAQGTSELWSLIALFDRGVWNYELEVKMVRQWLERSRMRSTRMSITCPPRTDFVPDESVSSDIFQLAVSHSAQLTDLSLNVHKTYLRRFLDRASLPALRSIAISLHPVHRIDEPMETNVPALISAPNLRHVAFKGDGSSIDLVPRSILGQITHLSFDCHTTLDLARLFHDIVRLEHLVLALPLPRDSQTQSDLKIVAPTLLCLEIHLDKDMLEFGDPEVLEALLDRFELPALQTLIVAAPLKKSRFDTQTGRHEAGWSNYAAWVDSPSIASLLARSRYDRPQLELRNLRLGPLGDHATKHG